MKRAWIQERLLFGDQPCMYRPCGREAVLLVAIPWVQFGSPPKYQETHGFTVFPMCETCFTRSHGNHGRKRKTGGTGAVVRVPRRVRDRPGARRAGAAPAVPARPSC